MCLSGLITLASKYRSFPWDIIEDFNIILILKITSVYFAILKQKTPWEHKIANSVLSLFLRIAYGRPGCVFIEKNIYVYMYMNICIHVYEYIYTWWSENMGEHCWVSRKQAQESVVFVLQVFLLQKQVRTCLLLCRALFTTLALSEPCWPSPISRALQVWRVQKKVGHFFRMVNLLI